MGCRERILHRRWFGRSLFGGLACLCLVLCPAGGTIGAGAVGSELEEILRSDRLTLKSGTTIRGKLLDRTKTRYVILVRLARRTVPAADVEKVSRGAPRKAREHFLAEYRQFVKDPSVERWRDLAAWAAELEETSGENLTPERLRALRALLRLESGDAAAKKERQKILFHAGTWYTASDLADYAVDDGKLVRKPADSDPKRDTRRTEVKRKRALPKFYRLLARKELSPSERKKLEKEIAARLQRARQARESQDLEYEGVDWVDRYKIRTKNFEVHCNSTRRVARLYGELMEIIRFELSRMFHTRVVRNFRAPVFIYKSQEEFLEQDFIGRWGGRGLGGYYMPASQRVVAFHGTFGFTGTTFSVLCHEGTHYYEGLVLKDFRNVPIWLIEGLAVYFGDGSDFDAKKKKIKVGKIPRDRLVHIQEKMEAGRHTDVKTLVKMKRRGRNPFTGSHYADAWALIYYLVHSGKEGESLLKEYWSIGIQRALKRQDFENLAKKYFGSLEDLEKAYVKYISGLELPQAGQVEGDYFISDRFRFMVKAPSPEWQFFTDTEDGKMLIGMLLPGSAVEIRVYYDNNLLNQEAAPYMQAYTKLLERSGGVKKPRKVKMGGLDAYMLRYVDDGKAPPEVSVTFSRGSVHVTKKRKKKRRFKGPRDVVEYKLVQIDGVVSIKCSAPKGEGRKHREVFEQVRAGFVLDPTRRW